MLWIRSERMHLTIAHQSLLGSSFVRGFVSAWFAAKVIFHSPAAALAALMITQAIKHQTGRRQTTRQTSEPNWLWQMFGEWWKTEKKNCPFFTRTTAIFFPVLLDVGNTFIIRVWEKFDGKKSFTLRNHENGNESRWRSKTHSKINSQFWQIKQLMQLIYFVESNRKKLNMNDIQMMTSAHTPNAMQFPSTDKVNNKINEEYINILDDAFKSSRTIFTIHKRQRFSEKAKTRRFPIRVKSARAERQPECMSTGALLLHMLHISRWHKSPCMIVVYISLRTESAERKKRCTHSLRFDLWMLRLKESNWASQRVS